MIPINPNVLRQVNASMVQDFADSAPVDLEVPLSVGPSHPDPNTADHPIQRRHGRCMTELGEGPERNPCAPKKSSASI